MKCNLCNQDSKLLKKSHIIPDFMYDGLFDEKHFMALVEWESLKVTQKKPTGIYDRYILCRKCDNEKIGKLETYASKVLNGGNFTNDNQPLYKLITGNKDISKVEISNVDYKKFKLFLISLLWRAHISKQDFFKEVKLGPYAEKMRLMLLEENPGNENDFEIGMIYFDEKLLQAKSLLPAIKFKMANNNCYLIHIKNLSMIYKISNQEQIELISSSKIKKNNSFSIFNLKNERASKFFEKMTGLKMQHKY